jgi:serine/threonine kinase 38
MKKMKKAEMLYKN